MHILEWACPTATRVHHMATGTEIYDSGTWDDREQHEIVANQVWKQAGVEQVGIYHQGDRRIWKFGP